MPFSPETYDSSLAQNVGDMTQQELVRRQVESTIRWRKVVDERGKLVRMSVVFQDCIINANDIK